MTMEPKKKAYYSVRIEGRKRKTRFKGSRNTVYRKLHERGFSYDRKARLWREPIIEITEEIKKPIQKEPNIKILISIGDYKHVDFDIIIKRVISSEDFRNLVSRNPEDGTYERIRSETIDMAAADLRSRGHFGLAKMLGKNINIDYVEGGEFVETGESETNGIVFERFDIRGDDRLSEINGNRKVPKSYDTEKQRKIE